MGFYSKKLSPSQQKYSTFGRELLALYEAVKHFRYFIQGLLFKLFTDHKPLEGAIIRKNDPLSAVQERQLAFLSEYATDIQHISGKNNILADALSRVLRLTHLAAGHIDLRQFRQDQDKDHVLCNLRNQQPNRFQLLPTNNIMLWCDITTTPRIWVPHDWVQRIFETIHGRDHPGARQTKANIAQSYIWQHMDTTIKRMVKACVACHASKVQTNMKVDLHEFPPPSERF